MAIWQAVLIGLFAYLGRNQVPWLFGTTGGLVWDWSSVSGWPHRRNYFGGY